MLYGILPRVGWQSPFDAVKSQIKIVLGAGFNPVAKKRRKNSIGIIVIAARLS